jgi:hypothetical protein
LNAHAHYIHWGWVQISYANLTVILLMIVVFVLAIVVPFPQHRSHIASLPDENDTGGQP